MKKTRTTISAGQGIGLAVAEKSAVQRVNPILNDLEEGLTMNACSRMKAMAVPGDSGYEYETEKNVPAPIAGTNSTKLTIVYNGADGYTPGDAYDLYLDENNMILEWVFRRGNSPEGRSTTWENVEQFGPIKLATTHSDDKGRKFIWFTNISVN